MWLTFCQLMVDTRMSFEGQLRRPRAEQAAMDGEQDRFGEDRKNHRVGTEEPPDGEFGFLRQDQCS